MVYLSVLGRQPEISLAELQALFSNVHQISPSLATFELSIDSQPLKNTLSFSDNSSASIDSSNMSIQNPRAIPPTIPTPAHTTPRASVNSLISRLGGSIKLAVKLEKDPLSYLKTLSSGKITLGISDYSKNASVRTAKTEALKLKKILVRHGRSVRIIENKSAVISTAASLHNGLGGKNERKIEFIKHNNDWYRVIGVQNIDSYARRDQARPARDAKVGMLPPKLAQILINLCGPLKSGSVILDPFCGTGVILQEALLMGYAAYGTDISDRMVDYSTRNLKWIISQARDARARRHGARCASSPLVAMPSKQPSQVSHDSSTPTLNNFQASQGDATTLKWSQPIDAVACEGYLGRPFSKVPSEMALKEQKQACASIALGFLRNLSGQIKSGTPVTFAVPAWLRPDSSYERLEILDEITKLGYNVNNKTREGLLYHRNDQVVARDILILRKK